MGYEDIRVAREGATAVLTIDRPKVNALRAQTMEEMARAADELGRDSEIRVVIITGAGERAFSGGADLASAFRGDVKPVLSSVEGGGSTGSHGDATIEAGLERFHEMLDKLEAGKPVIAALNGVAFGGGCELALACHFRLMDPKAEIGLTETNVGIFPAGGGTQRLPRIVGLGRAIDMIVFGRKIGAEEAVKIGLAHKVTRPGQALADALALAKEIEKRPPLAVQAALEAVMTGQRFGHAMGLAAERSGLARVVATEDALEGLQSFFEKRAPVWKGR